MNYYEKKAENELRLWKKKMIREPSFTNRLAKGIQVKTNNLIPPKVHNAITQAIKNMVKLVLAGSELTTKKPVYRASLEKRENLVRERLDFYRKAACASGAGTGAGGILIGLADFPILIGLKMKFLFDVASIYGFNVSDYKERLYILYIFQLAFSSQEKRVEIFFQMADWDNYAKSLPRSIDSFDWRSFQQEYRDYIDLAKILQLVPGIGAIVGAFANYRLMQSLGETAINAYRMRLLKTK